MLCIPISSLILLYCSRTFSWSKKLISIKMWFLGFVMILKHIICLPFRKPTLALYHYSLVVIWAEKRWPFFVYCVEDLILFYLYFLRNCGGYICNLNIYIYFEKWMLSYSCRIIRHTTAELFVGYVTYANQFVDSCLPMSIGFPDVFMFF